MELEEEPLPAADEGGMLEPLKSDHRHCRRQSSLNSKVVLILKEYSIVA